MGIIVCIVYCLVHVAICILLDTVLQYTALFFTLMFVGAHRLHCTNCDVLVLQETI